MRPSITGFFSLLLLAVACTYTLDEPSGVTKVITPVTPTGSISLTEYADVDTIYLFGTTTFTFDVRDLSNSQFEGEARFDNILFYTFNYRQGEFSIPSNYFNTGTHKLRLSFNESLTDESLISLLKDRQVTIFREWVVIIDIDPPPGFVIATSIENGYLKYTWPQYKKADFNDYDIISSSGYRYNRLFVEDPTKNFFIDSTYIDGLSGGASLQVAINTNHGSAQASAIVNEPPIKFSMVFHPEDTTASFAWSKPKYRGYFKSYTISDDLSTIAEVTNVTDTTLNPKIDGTFPLITQIHFRMLDRSGAPVFSADRSIDFFIGNELPPQVYGRSWYYSQSANKFITRSGANINIYDTSFNLLTSRSIQDNSFYGMTVAWPGNFLHYIGSGYTISQLNLITGSETSMPIEGDNLPVTYVNAVSGADNQVVSFNAIDNDHVHPTKNFIGLVNMQTSTVLQQDEGVEWTTLADDGRYSFARPEVYSVSGGTQTHIGTIPGDYYFRWFRGDNTDEIITSQFDDPRLVNEVKTIILRSNDLQILRTFDQPEAGFSVSSYDPATKTLLYTKFGSTKVYLVNIDTGSKKVFKANGGLNTPLVNGIIIIGTRYIKAI